MTCISCGKKTFSREFVINNMWHNHGGWRFRGNDGFMIKRDTSLILKGDTILWHNIPGAIIILVEEENDYMEIKSLETKEIGEYYNLSHNSH